MAPDAHRCPVRGPIAFLHPTGSKRSPWRIGPSGQVIGRLSFDVSPGPRSGSKLEPIEGTHEVSSSSVGTDEPIRSLPATASKKLLGHDSAGIVDGIAGAPPQPPTSAPSS